MSKSPNSPVQRVGPNKTSNSPNGRVGSSKSSRSPVQQVGPNKTSNSPIRRVGTSKSSNSPVRRLGPNKQSNSPIQRVGSTSLPSFRPRSSLFRDQIEPDLVSSRSELSLELYDLKTARLVFSYEIRIGHIKWQQLAKHLKLPPLYENFKFSSESMSFRKRSFDKS